jgi:hypothetical protein
MDIGGSLTIGASATVDVRRCGFYPGQPSNNGGATHGGYGGGTTAPTAPYGSILTPDLPGTGCLTTGGTGNTNGGGVVWIRVTGATTLNGGIDASGLYNGGTYCRAGAGGTIYLRTGSLSGSGVIRARGMNSGGGSNTGNGGGGRIAVFLTDPGATFASFDTTKIDAWQGTGGNSTAKGTAGSVYLQTGAETAGGGTLVVDFGNMDGDLVDDKAFTLTGENLAACKLELKRQAHLRFTTTKSVGRVTADSTAHVTVDAARTGRTDRLVVNATEYAAGYYLTADLPGFLYGSGVLQVLVGAAPPRGVMLLLK